MDMEMIVTPRNIRRRGWIIFVMLLLLLAGVIGRLLYLQVLQYDYYTRLSTEQSQGRLFMLPVRGKILDRHLHPLAESIDTKSLVMTSSRFDPQSQTVQQVSTLLDINLETISARTPENSRLTYLKRRLAPEEVVQIQTALEPQDLLTTGMFLIPDTKRFYPQQRLASHLLGFTGLDEHGYENRGLEGLEFHYDEYLRGHAEQHSVPMDAKRNSLNSWDLDVKNVGYTLVLTLDKNIQYMVERELEMTFREERARHASVIVMNPHTGEILAMANYPDYNPNEFQSYPQQYYKNWAATWAYEPGSTFKIIQTAAALEEGVLSPHDRLDNQGHFQDGATRSESEWKKFGYLSVEDILIQSSNMGAMMISDVLGKERFYGYMRRFGFGEVTGIDLPGEAPGKLREINEWSNLSLQSLSIGQEIAVTPLQIARAFTVIANGGLLYTPYIVREIQDMDGAPILQVEPRLVQRVISPKTAKLMREMLAKVVEQGTGKRAATKGYRVGGKTGTAQKFNALTGDYSSTSLVTSFVGFAPVDYPQVVIAAVVDEPAENEWGSTVAAPLFKRIAERVLPYLDIPPDNPVQELIAFNIKDLRLVDDQ